MIKKKHHHRHHCRKYIVAHSKDFVRNWGYNTNDKLNCMAFNAVTRRQIPLP